MRKLVFFNKLQQGNYATHGDTMINYHARSYIPHYRNFAHMLAYRILMISEYAY